MRVVGLGAICDIDSDGANAGHDFSFVVSEFVQLDNGERIILHAERGFSGHSSTHDIWAYQSVDTITRDVLNTVLPDGDESDDEHPWEWLAELSAAHGLNVTPDELRQVPYSVELTERLLRRLPAQS